MQSNGVSSTDVAALSSARLFITEGISVILRGGSTSAENGSRQGRSKRCGISKSELSSPRTTAYNHRYPGIPRIRKVSGEPSE